MRWRELILFHGDENLALDTDGNKINFSSNILSEKEVDGFVFDSFDVVTQNGITTISYEIYNPDEENKNLGEYELKIIDSDYNIIDRKTDDAGTIEGLSRKEVSLEFKGDVSNLFDIVVSKIVYKQI